VPLGAKQFVGKMSAKLKGIALDLALALALRANARILVDEALFDRAGVRLSTTPCEPHR
jgi:hypothetical protein